MLATDEAFHQATAPDEPPDYLHPLTIDELPKLAERHPSIGDVRGLGLFWGLELVRDRETREPLVPFNAGGEAAEPMTRITKACLERGLYPFAHWNVLAITPPLTITREELDEGIGVLDEVLAIADEYASA